MLFGAGCEGLVADGAARWVNLEDLRSMLLVASDQSDCAAEGANTRVLGESLQSGAHALGKHLNGALVAEFHLELACSCSDLSDHDSGIVLVSDNDSTDAIGDFVDV